MKRNQVFDRAVIMVLSTVLGLPAPVLASSRAQTVAAVAQGQAPAGGGDAAAWHARLPYRSSARVKKLLDTIGVRALIGYSERSASEGRWKTAGRAGVMSARYFVRSEGSRARTIELAVVPYPAGGHELYLYGSEDGAGGERPNPDLPAIQAAITELLQSLERDEQEALNAPLDRRRLEFMPVQLSYAQSDRALGMLKALGYTTIEFSGADSESLFQKIYSPAQSGDWRLPVVIKMIDARKTSLQDPGPPDPNAILQPQMAMPGAITARNLLPDLGGLYLHQDTSGEPTERLLVAYDADDVEPLEQLVNLLREKIDVPARQLVIEALVIEIQSDATKDIGFSFTAAGTSGLDEYRDDYVLSAGGKDTRVAPNDPLNFLFSRVGDLFKFNATLRALVESSKAKILSNPSVLVLDGRQAKIQIGNQIPVPATTITTNTSTESVTYFPVGIVLNLRPRISEDNSEISMQVETIVSSVRAIGLSAVTDVRAPEVESRQVQTFVRVANDTPFIIGGLTSTEELKRRSGVPILSTLPFVGGLFRRDESDNLRKEIIVVLTPHIVPQETSNFAHVIPQESPIFDSFGHQLFYNAFRIRRQDIYDLAFLHESRVWQELRQCVEQWTGSHPGKAWEEPYASILGGSVPGEEVLIRRMLWETILKADYLRFLDPAKIIFFEDVSDSDDGTGYRLANLGKLLREPPLGPGEALELTFDRHGEGTPEHPFARPRATVGRVSIQPEQYISRLTHGNRRGRDGSLQRSTVVLMSQAAPGHRDPMDVLKGVLILRRILELNKSLNLTVADFHAGRQVVFPTESDLRGSFHLLDRDAAKMFYEVMSYYPAFEQEFKYKSQLVAHAMGGCQGWLAGAEPAPGIVPARLAGREEIPLAPAATPAPRPVTAPVPVQTPAPSPAAGLKLPPPPPAVAPEPTPLSPAAATSGAASPLERELSGLGAVVDRAPAGERAELSAHLAAATTALSANREAQGWLELGQFYLGARMNNAAMLSLRKAEALDPANADVHRAMAEVHDRSGNQKEARRRLELAEAAAIP